MSSNRDFEARFLSGREIYGDDFTQNEIDEWFADEREGYANLGSGADGDPYHYHALNERHGYRHLPARRFRHALGVGSAYGLEFEPIVDRLDRVTILEPSDQLVGGRVGGISLEYVKPDPTGTMPFSNSTFDLVVCLGTLHHIPNVSHVVHEIGRVLEPGGFALIREPIVSMGDWRQSRAGITDRERGIPLDHLTKAVRDAGLAIQHRSFSGFPATARLGRLLGKAPFNFPSLTALDSFAARLTLPNYTYHAQTAWRKVRPTSVFLVAEKG